MRVCGERVLRGVVALLSRQHQSMAKIIHADSNFPGNARDPLRQAQRHRTIHASLEAVVFAKCVRERIVRIDNDGSRYRRAAPCECAARDSAAVVFLSQIAIRRTCQT